MSPAEIRAVIKDELARIAPEVEFESLDPTADLREAVDIDSMDFLNFVTALHLRLGVEIPEADNPRLVTLEGAVDYLAGKLGAAS